MSILLQVTAKIPESFVIIACTLVAGWQHFVISRKVVRGVKVKVKVIFFFFFDIVLDGL